MLVHGPTPVGLDALSRYEALLTVSRAIARHVRVTMRLDDGTEIYSKPSAGPLADTVKPAAFMARARDLAAIFDAVSEDTPVYIY